MRQHASAHVSIRQHTPAYVSIRQHTSAHVSIRQHTSAHVSIALAERQLTSLSGVLKSSAWSFAWRLRRQYLHFCTSN
jgi:hypothetical protein